MENLGVDFRIEAECLGVLRETMLNNEEAEEVNIQGNWALIAAFSVVAMVQLELAAGGKEEEEDEEDEGQLSWRWVASISVAASRQTSWSVFFTIDY